MPNEGSRGLAVRPYGAADGHVEVLPTSVDVAAVRERGAHATRDGARRLMGISEDEQAFVLLTDFDSGATMDRVLSGLPLALGEEPPLRISWSARGGMRDRPGGRPRSSSSEIRLSSWVVARRLDP